MVKAKQSTTSLIVGFNEKQKPGKLGALHRKFGVRQAEKLNIIDGYSIEIPTREVDHYLAALPESANVMFDGPLLGEPGVTEVPTPAVSPVEDRILEVEEPLPYVSRPAGLELLHAQGIDGRGTTVAVVDSGLSPHGDFGDRIALFKDFSSSRNTKANDSNGHGTHVAGIGVGDGARVDGIAPRAKLVGLRISSALEAIKAIEWAVDHRDDHSIDVLNISLGVPDRLTHGQDPFAQAAQNAINSGLITVVAAGNEGQDCRLDDPGGLCHGTISSPGSLPDAITVGAFDDGGTIALDDDKIWAKSSAGPTASDKTAKPDLVAPGVGILAPTAVGSDKSRSHPRWQNYHLDTGSSMAAPMVTGAVALMLQVHPGLTQAEAKALLTKTAIPMAGVSADVQGAGRLNLKNLIEESRQLK